MEFQLLDVFKMAGSASGLLALVVISIRWLTQNVGRSGSGAQSDAKAGNVHIENTGNTNSCSITVERQLAMLAQAIQSISETLKSYIIASTAKDAVRESMQAELIRSTISNGELLRSVHRDSSYVRDAVNKLRSEDIT